MVLNGFSLEPWTKKYLINKKWGLRKKRGKKVRQNQHSNGPGPFWAPSSYLVLMTLPLPWRTKKKQWWTAWISQKISAAKIGCDQLAIKNTTVDVEYFSRFAPGCWMYWMGFHFPCHRPTLEPRRVELWDPENFTFSSGDSTSCVRLSKIARETMVDVDTINFIDGGLHHTTL